MAYRITIVEESLQKLFARLGPIKSIKQNTFGSPYTVVLRLPICNHVSLKTIDATLALAKCGLTLLHAKHVIEEISLAGEIRITLPMIENRYVLVWELASSGIIAEIFPVTGET
jgi:hypothetical protein